MQTILVFKGRLKDSIEVIEQRVPITSPDILESPAKLVFTIQKMLVELGLGGMVHKRDNTMTLIPGARFHEIWCEIPNIVIASQ